MKTEKGWDLFVHHNHCMTATMADKKKRYLYYKNLFVHCLTRFPGISDLKRGHLRHRNMVLH